MAGKLRAKNNALRHGLAAMPRANPSACAEIEQMAKAICAGDHHPLLFEQALIIAESDFVLRCVRAQRIAVIERVREVTAIALARGDNRLALAKARVRQMKLAAAELKQIRARLANPGLKLPSTTQGGPNPPAQCAAHEAPPEERDEVDALREAIPDLRRLERYERRAWSRRKHAIRAWTEIKCEGEHRVDVLAAQRRRDRSTPDGSA